MYEAIGLAEPGKGQDNGTGMNWRSGNQMEPEGSGEAQGHRVAMHSQREGERERQDSMTDNSIAAL